MESLEPETSLSRSHYTEMMKSKDASSLVHRSGDGGGATHAQIGAHPSSVVRATEREGEVRDGRNRPTRKASLRGGALLILFGALSGLIALHIRAERLMVFSAGAIERVGDGVGPRIGPQQSRYPERAGGSKAHPRIAAVDVGGVREPSQNLRATAAKTAGHNRTIKVWREEMLMRQRLLDDEYYDLRRRPDLPRGCEPLRTWQTASFPSCNLLHEVDRTVESWSSGRHRWTNQGGYNLVFAVREEMPSLWEKLAENDQEPSFAIKEIDYPYSDATDSTFYEVQMDALVMERLTSSPYVMDIYAHCGLTLVVPWGDIQLGRLIFDGKDPPREEKLRLAVQVSSALADVENMDGDGTPSYVHMDYMVRQHLLVNGTLKLSDFNKGRFMSKRSSSGGGLCEFRRVGRDGTFRSPEEYRGEPLTPKMQVFSLGNILQSILTGERMWTGVEDDDARDRIQRGKRYRMARFVKKSTDPIDVALRKMARRCFAQDPEERPSAVGVADFLREQASRLGVSLLTKS